MATKTLSFKKIYLRNPFRAIKFRFRRDADDIPKQEAAFTRRRARSIMKKGVKKPKTRYGQYKRYNRRHAKTGKWWYYQSGLYSRPGTPPFHYGQTFNLRTIFFNKIGGGNVNIPVPKFTGGHANAYRVGPAYRQQRHRIPTPQLHEYGGVRKLSRQGATFTDRGHVIQRRGGGSGTAKYPPRPYMRPAASEARRSVKAKRGGSLPRLVKMGGLRGRRIY